MSTNVRKAAILLRSVDSDTATTLLAQLSTEEAAVLREAMRAIGPVDPDERAEVLAEFRRQRPLASPSENRGVELSLSSKGALDTSLPSPPARPVGIRFDFLENAPAKTLATYLAREHVQTIAVVLSHLPPDRAAAVLAALPEKSQAEVIERLSNLGDTDANALAVLEDELATWVKARIGNADNTRHRRDTVSSILAASDAKTREGIVAKLKAHNPDLAQHLQAAERQPARQPVHARHNDYQVLQSSIKRHHVNGQLNSLIAERAPAKRLATPPPVTAPLPRIAFDQLVHMDSRVLAQLLEVTDPNLLALALAGSKDELVERICDQMPRRIAKTFRREVRRMGPTRLSDVEAAQRAIADLAARQIALRRQGTAHSALLQNA